jgi:superfamily II DNA or RNA helicase
MSRVRLLLADGVGLGKTVQAGLVLTELMARRLVQRVLIVSPAGPLLEQWRTEMRDRFGLRLRVMDRGEIDEIRREVELGANPFDHVSLALASVDFLKQERVLAELERTSYDVVIIDEAHHCVDLGAAGVREDSLRRRLAEVLAGQCDSLLLLTATPHDGNDRSFASLCELLDPSLVDGRGVIRGDRFRRHVVRRLKRHIKDVTKGGLLFPDRDVKPCRVVVQASSNPVFVEMSKQLLALVAPELRRALRDKRYSDVLSFFALLKRSVSTVAACRSTLAVVRDRHRAALEERVEEQAGRRERIRTLRDARRRLDRFGVATSADECELEQLELEDVAQQLADLERMGRSERRKIGRVESITTTLDRLVEMAGQAIDHDPKIAELQKEISAIRRVEPHANILVYTEYTTSQSAVADALQRDGHNVLMLSGNDGDKERTEITDRFRNNDDLILVSTDAAAEGLNLHQRCHHLMHLELPFNPNRLEQRNGRIDRYGQKLQPIVRYFYLAETFEENILLRLIAKYERQRAKLTFVPNTLGLTASSDQTTARLLRGVLESEDTLFVEQPIQFTLLAGEPADGATEAVRELLAEIDRSFGSFEKTAKSNAWLADAGICAEESMLHAAGDAKEAGDATANVNLAQFAVDAVLRDGGKLMGRVTDRSFELTLPGSWRVDLSDTPGADPDSRTIRLTTNKEVILDQSKRLVGYLGRAHPLIRHVIDRVRYTSLGDGSGQLDTRAAAVKADVSKPTLVCTFLARVDSAAGREFERVVSVQLTKSGSATYSDRPADWMQFTASECAIASTDVWKTHFADWATDLFAKAADQAREGSKDACKRFIMDASQSASRELEEIDHWLTERAGELAPPVATQQFDLFAQTTPPTAAPQPTTPAERLSALRNDPKQPVRLRSQVEWVLKLYEDRRQRLQRHADFRQPEVIPLGMLMVVPEVEHGA